MLFYTDEVIKNEDGVDCKVLDTDKVDFTDAYVGRKSAETLVVKADGTEKIETINSAGLVESVYEPNMGDAIFVNSETDKYVPRDSMGNAWQFDSIESYGYEKSTDVFLQDGKPAVKVKSTKLASLLPEIISVPTCIKAAWGVGAHQFLFAGATLKKDNETGKVTGIDKEAFDRTWEIIENKNRTL